MAIDDETSATKLNRSELMRKTSLTFNLSTGNRFSTAIDQETQECICPSNRVSVGLPSETNREDLDKFVEGNSAPSTRSCGRVSEFNLIN